MEDDFYLTLLSNSSHKYYRDNRTSRFKVHLTKEINLDENWRAALSEISYPHTIFNVSENSNCVILKYSYFTGNVKDIDTTRINIPVGYYPNVEGILKAINGQFMKAYSMNLFAETLSTSSHTMITANMEELEHHLAFSTLTAQGRVADMSMKDYESAVEITLENRLAIQLGFSPTDNLVDFEQSPQIANINFGWPQEVFVYMDIIEPQIISDYFSQVIKIVKTLDHQTQFSELVNREILNRNYLTLNKRRFQTITIELRDSSGELIPFQFGTSIVTVHFKKAAQ